MATINCSILVHGQGNTIAEDLIAQLLQAQGFEVYFAGLPGHQKTMSVVGEYNVPTKDGGMDVLGKRVMIYPGNDQRTLKEFRQHCFHALDLELETMNAFWTDKYTAYPWAKAFCDVLGEEAHQRDLRKQRCANATRQMEVDARKMQLELSKEQQYTSEGLHHKYELAHFFAVKQCDDRGNLPHDWSYNAIVFDLVRCALYAGKQV